MTRSLSNSYVLFGLLLICPMENLWAAACCGGSFAAPSILTGDDRLQVTATYSYNRLVANVLADGVWRKNTTSENIQTWKIDGAHLLADLWQVGTTVPLVKISESLPNSQQTSSIGWGDITFDIGYEYLRDWDYNPWRPKGIAFLQITAPTGKSVFQSNDPHGLDVRGRGFWSLGLGSIFTKALPPFDGQAMIEAHRSLPQNTDNNQGNFRLSPGYGGSLGLGAGWSNQSLRLGTNLTWSYEDPVNVAGDIHSSGDTQRFTTMTLAASYLWNQEYASTVSYSDQTWFGSPTNSALGRIVALSLQRRWPR